MRDLLKLAAVMVAVFASTFFLFERSGLITEAGLRSLALHSSFGREPQHS